MPTFNNLSKIKYCQGPPHQCKSGVFGREAEVWNEQPPGLDLEGCPGVVPYPDFKDYADQGDYGDCTKYVECYCYTDYNDYLEYMGVSTELDYLLL